MNAMSAQTPCPRIEMPLSNISTHAYQKKGVAVEKLFLKHLTRQNVIGYLNWILDERNCSPATRNYRLAAIHAFVSFLQYNIIEQSEEWQKILSIKAMRTEKKALNYLSQDGIRLLLHQPDVTIWQGTQTSGDALADVRHRSEGSGDCRSDR